MEAARAAFHHGLRRRWVPLALNCLLQGSLALAGLLVDHEGICKDAKDAYKQPTNVEQCQLIMKDKRGRYDSEDLLRPERRGAVREG